MRPAEYAPITSTRDPRWIVAVRAAELLQGGRLPPGRRDGLLALARSLRMSPFDANLIIAIVEEQVRLGHPPAACPAAGEPELRRVPSPQMRGWPSRWTVAGLAAAGVLLAEATALWVWFA